MRSIAVVFICVSQSSALGSRPLCSGIDCDFQIVHDSSSLLQKDLQAVQTDNKATFGTAHENSLTKKRPVSGLWTNPIILGIVLGLLLIGPDHLGTLMALSTLTTGLGSFKVGFAWGLGHSLGMILICPIFLLLREVSSKSFHVSVEQWEYMGDYLIGASMVLIAAYFFVFESWYLEKQADGSFKAKGCPCCPTADATVRDDKPSAKKFCASYCKPGCTDTASKHPPAADEDVEQSPIQEDAPLLPKAKAYESAAASASSLFASLYSVRNFQGAALGLLQGLCCPMGLAGLGFMGRMSVSSSPLMLVLFALSFAVASGFGSGVITFGWGAITSSGGGSCMSPRTMYLSSCVMTGLLGVVWIAANACGVLEHINIEEKIHHKILHNAIMST